MTSVHCTVVEPSLQDIHTSIKRKHPGMPLSGCPALVVIEFTLIIFLSYKMYSVNCIAIENKVGAPDHGLQMLKRKG